MSMETLHKAIQTWYEASAAYDKAFAEYEGYSWGWDGHELIEARQQAAENLEAVLDGHISRKVQEAIAELT